MNDADCMFCEDALLSDTTNGFLMRRFIVCPDCGNKRCPKASAHWQACSGSNDVGQPGSYYGPEEHWPKEMP